MIAKLEPLSFQQFPLILKLLILNSPLDSIITATEAINPTSTYLTSLTWVAIIEAFPLGQFFFFENTALFFLGYFGWVEIALFSNSVCLVMGV